MTLLLLITAPLAVVAFILLTVRSLIYVPLDRSGEPVVFEIVSGESSVAIAQRLEDEGLVKSAYAFLSYNFYRGRHQDLKAGRYEISPAMNTSEISAKIAEGRALPELVITFPEGLNLRQWQERLEPHFPSIDLFAYTVSDFWDDFPFLRDAPAEATLEGYLYPDTYYFSKQTEGRQLVNRFLANFQRQLGDLLEEIEARGENIHHQVIKASLIEKEVRSWDDKRLVAGLINRRLEIGMPLQICATITYLTGRASSRVTTAETQIDSPYNTYLYPGLPVGPICNPGKKSLQAVLNPSQSNYLFYLSTPEGETIFSRNLDEHNRARAKYLNNS